MYPGLFMCTLFTSECAFRRFCEVLGFKVAKAKQIFKENLLLTMNNEKSKPIVNIWSYMCVCPSIFTQSFQPFFHTMSRCLA